jgi:5-dehydro-2-deoxygluconokinase
MSRISPIPVEVVCGLGAGDAFGGAFCASMLVGATPEDAVRAGNAAGAIVASRLACADAMPTRPELDATLEEGTVGSR